MNIKVDIIMITDYHPLTYVVIYLSVIDLNYALTKL